MENFCRFYSVKLTRSFKPLLVTLENKMSRIFFTLLTIMCSTSSFSNTLDNNNSGNKGYYPGMLISKDSYVRLKNCSQNSDYTLLPAGKYGYEAMAELISIRKNTSPEIPISVGIQGEVEYDATHTPSGNFLVRGLEFIKVNESCDIVLDPAPSKQEPTSHNLAPEDKQQKPALLETPPLPQTNTVAPIPETEPTESSSASNPSTNQMSAEPDEYGILEEIISTHTYRKAD